MVRSRPGIAAVWLLGWLNPLRAARRLVALVAVLAVAAFALGLTPASLSGAWRDVRATVEDAVGGLGVLGGEQLAGRVTHVVDGDTLDVAVREDGSRREVRVRLVGIDTPESKRPGWPVMCGALEAEHHLLALTFTAPRDSDGDGLLDAEGGRGRRVVLEPDASQDELDRYGRRIGYVFLTGRERSLQERLLAAGWADVYVYAGREFERLDDFERAARAARRADRGVHAVCGGDFDRPR